MSILYLCLLLLPLFLIFCCLQRDFEEYQSTFRIKQDKIRTEAPESVPISVEALLLSLTQDVHQIVSYS